MSSSKNVGADKGKGTALKGEGPPMTLEEVIKLEEEKGIRRLNLDPKNARVHISGFRGTHDIPTAIAYFMRGHYVYTSDGTHVTPILGKPSKALNVTTSISKAPPYSPHAANLIDEANVNAVEKTKWNMKAMAEESKQATKAEGSKRCKLPEHGDDCDGEHTGQHVTAMARAGAGFTQIEPRVMGPDGTLLMHWAYIYNEEKGKQAN